MDWVHISRGTLVTNEVSHAQWLVREYGEDVALCDVVSLHYAPAFSGAWLVSMAVVRDSATSVPSAFLNSVMIS